MKQNWTIKTLRNDWRESSIKQRIWFMSCVTLELVFGIAAIIYSAKFGKSHTNSDLINALVSLSIMLVFTFMPTKHNSRRLDKP